MDKSVYQNAIDLLKFPDDLTDRVASASRERGPRFGLLRVAVLAAVICGLLSVTVYAVDGWLKQDVEYNPLGTETLDASNAKILELELIYSNEGVTIHSMELPPAINYYSGHGLIFNGSNRVYKITEDYQLEEQELKQIIVPFEKNGVEYHVSLLYVPVEGGIRTIHSLYYPVTNGEILINAFKAPNISWPVYLNLETHEVRDALAQYDQDDFEGVEFFAPYKNGFYVGTLVETEEDSYNLDYVVNLREGTLTQVQMNGADSFVYQGELYAQDRKNNKLYHYTDSGEFEPLNVTYLTQDDVNQGLLTVYLGKEGYLGVIDVARQITYHVPDVKVNAHDLDWNGTNASRYSPDSKIVVTERLYDYENRRESMSSISVLDPANNQYKRLMLETEYEVSACSWLDENRYAVVYRDGFRYYLYIYEFE